MQVNDPGQLRRAILRLDPARCCVSFRRRLAFVGDAKNIEGKKRLRTAAQEMPKRLAGVTTANVRRQAVALRSTCR